MKPPTLEVLVEREDDVKERISDLLLHVLLRGVLYRAQEKEDILLRPLICMCVCVCVLSVHVWCVDVYVCVCVCMCVCVHVCVCALCVCVHCVCVCIVGVCALWVCVGVLCVCVWIIHWPLRLISHPPSFISWPLSSWLRPVYEAGRGRRSTPITSASPYRTLVAAQPLQWRISWYTPYWSTESSGYLEEEEHLIIASPILSLLHLLLLTSHAPTLSSLPLLSFPPHSLVALPSSYPSRSPHTPVRFC